MYKLKYNITLNNKSLSQILFINEEMIILFVNDKWNVFIKEKNQMYHLNMDAQNLSPINYSAFKSQLEHTLLELGNIEISEKLSTEIILGYSSKKYCCTNSKIVPHFKSEIKVLQLPGLENTIYSAYISFENQNQLIQIPIENNELLAYNMTELTFLAGNHNQRLEIVSIEEYIFPKDLLNIREFEVKK